MIAYRINNPFLAERAIEKGKINYWEMCRPHIADPERTTTRLETEVTPDLVKSIAPQAVVLAAGLRKVMW